MNVIDTKIVTKRGESFTVGFLISRECNGYEFPYWTDAGVQNPYYLLQVRNSEFYQKDKGSIYNYWIQGIILTSSGQTNYNLLQCHGSPKYSANQDIPSDCKDGDLFYSGSSDLTFYVSVKSSTKEKVKVDWTMFKKTFLPVDIKNFRQGTWWYDIRLVSGVKMIDYLRGKYEGFFNGRNTDGTIIGMDIHTKREYELYGKSPKWLYDRICSYDSKFKGSINWEYPLVNYQTVDELIYPRKLIVR